jgi:kanamycin nucleotidyltransferase
MDDAASRPFLPQGRAADLFGGPQEMSSTERRAIADAALSWLQAEFGQDLVAAALYGSSAVERDGPFSDVEMWAAIEDGAGGGRSLEWVWGPGKLEVNLLGVSELLTRALEIDERWPLTHGKFVHAEMLWEAPRQAGFVARIKEAAADLPEAPRRAAMGECVLGLYELVGKLRNSRLTPPSDVPRLMIKLAEMACCLVLLQHRYAVFSGRRLFGEAFQLEGPETFKDLLRRVANGVLLPPGEMIDEAEAFWASLPAWLDKVGLDVGPLLRPQTPDLEIPWRAPPRRG